MPFSTGRPFKVVWLSAPHVQKFCLSKYAKGFQFKHVPGGFSHAFWAYLVKNAYVYIFVFTIIQLAINLKCLDMPKETFKTPRLCELEAVMVLMSKKAKRNTFSRHSGYLTLHRAQSSAVAGGERVPQRAPQAPPPGWKRRGHGEAESKLIPRPHPQICV